MMMSCFFFNKILQFTSQELKYLSKFFERLGSKSRHISLLHKIFFPLDPHQLQYSSFCIFEYNLRWLSHFHRVSRHSSKR